jgi:osmotically-inducible protein OsmY
VNNGWVILRGEVDWDFQKEAAEDAVRLLCGVRGVSNWIKVKSEAPIYELSSRIEGPVGITAEADAVSVRVEKHDAIVSPGGEVRS